ncbi:MAG: hypothetical protein AAGD92_16040 [Pseudomonadota bacterium]
MASKSTSFTSGILGFLFILHSATTVLSVIWLFRWMASDGALSGGDIALGLALGVSLLIALYTLSNFGVEKVPELRGQLMRTGLLVWITATLMFGVTSGMTSAATLSTTRGFVIHHETYLRDVSRAFSERSNLIRSVEGLQHATAKCMHIALGAEEKEIDGGEISKTGSGDGQTARELQNIADQCESAGAIIVDARTKTQPLFKEADRLMEEIRRTTENPAISVREKEEVLVSGSERISVIEDELIAAMSLGSLDSVTDILMRDYLYIGLSSEAARFIESSFRPIARQILAVIDETSYTLDRPFPQFEKRDSLELLALYPGKLWPSLTFAAVLEGVPLIIVGFSILLTLQRRKSDPDSSAPGRERYRRARDH